MSSSSFTKFIFPVLARVFPRLLSLAPELPKPLLVPTPGVALYRLIFTHGPNVYSQAVEALKNAGMQVERVSTRGSLSLRVVGNRTEAQRILASFASLPQEARPYRATHNSR